MSNEKNDVVVVEENSLRTEAKTELEQYLIDCLNNAKAPAKKLAGSAIERGIDKVVNYIRNYLALH